MKEFAIGVATVAVGVVLGMLLSDQVKKLMA